MPGSTASRLCWAVGVVVLVAAARWPGPSMRASSSSSDELLAASPTSGPPLSEDLRLDETDSHPVDPGLLDRICTYVDEGRSFRDIVTALVEEGVPEEEASRTVNLLELVGPQGCHPSDTGEEPRRLG